MSVQVYAISENDINTIIESQGKDAVSGNFFIWFLCAVGFLKVSQKIDSFMAGLGISAGRTGGSLMAEALIAGKTIMSGGKSLVSKGYGNPGAGGVPSSKAKDTFSGGLTGMVGRNINQSAVQSATNNGGGIVGKTAFESSLKNNGSFANDVIGEVAHGDIQKTGSITGDMAEQALHSYLGEENSIENQRPLNSQNDISEASSSTPTVSTSYIENEATGYMEDNALSADPSSLEGSVNYGAEPINQSELENPIEMTENVPTVYPDVTTESAGTISMEQSTYSPLSDMVTELNGSDGAVLSAQDNTTVDDMNTSNMSMSISSNVANNEGQYNPTPIVGNLTEPSLTQSEQGQSLPSMQAQGSTGLDYSPAPPALISAETVEKGQNPTGISVPTTDYAVASYSETPQAVRPNYRDVEIGGGRITGVELTPEYPKGLDFALYSVEKYMKPEGKFETIKTTDGKQWYKQYAVDHVEKMPIPQENGKIKYETQVIKKLPQTPKRKDRV